MQRTRPALAAAAALLVALAVAGPAAASFWCGENGLIRFSFAEGDSLQPVLFAEPDANGLTRVDLWVWLTDVEPMAKDGEAVLAVGGYELELVVEGAEAFVSGKEFPGEGLNVAADQWGCILGLNPNPRLQDGRTLLVKYELLFEGLAENVRFSIRPEGIISCGTVDGCPGSGTRALWIGPMESDMLSEIFGAGCVPAWLNPTGEPDLTPERGTVSWRDVGRFQPRKSGVLD
ncbi:MAG: hypothetical protein ABR506_10625 [Candidatus Krumholzibacteriia bacterium]